MYVYERQRERDGYRSGTYPGILNPEFDRSFNVNFQSERG